MENAIKTSTPFSRKVTKSTTQVDTIEHKKLRNKAFAMNHWLKPLLESITLIESPNPNPSPAFFLTAIAKAQIDTHDPANMCLTPPDLFLRVKPDNAENIGYTGYLIHSVVLSIGPALLEAINEQKGNDYFVINAPFTSEQQYTAKHCSKFIEFLYTGALAFDESDQKNLMLLADDFGIDAFCVAIQLAKERAEQDSNNPFKEKVEDKKKFGKHRSDGGKKSFKNKSVGKNRSEGKSKGDGKMKENFSNLKTMMEFMKMMKN